jgi:dihydroxyacid dehydratase/phosphogluconate dehydratase
MDAFNGGPIGAIKSGAIIDIGIPGRTLNLELEENRIKRRLSEATPPNRQLTTLLAWLPWSV